MVTVLAETIILMTAIMTGGGTTVAESRIMDAAVAILGPVAGVR